jgi:hypothetical protein
MEGMFKDCVAKAIEMHLSALRIYQELGDRAGEAYTLERLSSCHIKLGNLVQAQQLLQQSLALRQQHPGQAVPTHRADRWSVLETFDGAGMQFDSSLTNENPTVSYCSNIRSII